MDRDRTMLGVTGQSRARRLGYSVWLMLAALPALALGTLPAAAGSADRIVQEIDFSDYDEGPVEDWLQAKGFVFQEDAKRRDRVELDTDGSGLIIENRRQALGLLMNESISAPAFNHIEIEWGVNRFPEGASYEQKVNNEAIMVYVFLGDERVASGSWLVPDSPYFIGLFLCKDDEVDKPYVGRYFQKGGRYVCLDRPEPGEVVTSRFDLLAAYRTYFDKEGDDDPVISGLAVSADTGKSGDGGQSEGFVRRVTLIE